MWRRTQLRFKGSVKLLMLAAVLSSLIASLLTVHGQPSGPSFTLTVSPSTLTIEAGASGTAQISVTATGANLTVTLSAAGVPSDLSVSINPISGTTPFTSTLTVEASASAQGEYEFTVQGVGEDGWTEWRTVTVHVPGFILTVDPECVIAVNGSSTSATIKVLSLLGYNRTVSLSVLGVPAGVTYTLSPSQGVPSFDSTLTLDVAGTAPFGTYWLTVRGVGTDGKTRSVTVEFAIVYLNISAAVTPKRDEWGRPRGNPDETYYPGDGFWINYTVVTKNLQFVRVELNFSEAVFTAPRTVYNQAGNVSVEIKKTAPPGKHTITVTAVAVYTSAAGKTFHFKLGKEIAVTVVAYDPHFTVLLSYTVLNATGDAAYEKPFAIIVRYEGNGPERRLSQRALVESFTWTGYAAREPSNETLMEMPPISLGESVFHAIGLDKSAGGVVLTVDGVGYTVWDLPKRFRWAAGSNHTYTWTLNVPSTTQVDPWTGEIVAGEEGVWFLWTVTLGSSMNRTDTITASPWGNMVLALYTPCKDLQSFAPGQQIVNWTRVQLYDENGTLIYTQDVEDNKPVPPPLFVNEVRYGKFVMDMDDGVMHKVLEQNYTSLTLNLTFWCGSFTPTPKRVLAANYTVMHEMFVQPLQVKAHRPDGAGGWLTDDSVYMRAEFVPALNVTEKDLFTAWFGNQTSDEVAIKIAVEDLYEPTPQVFSGWGMVAGQLRKTSPHFFNVTVTAEGYGRKVRVERFNVYLPFHENRTYVVYVNMVGGGLSINVTRDSGLYAHLQVFALPEAGGLRSVSIIDQAGRLIHSINFTEAPSMEQGIMGFYGEHAMAISKRPDMGTRWLVKMENVWGAVTQLMIEVQPYSKPPLMFMLDELAMGLFWIIAVAIMLSLILFLVKGEHGPIFGRGRE